MHQFLKEEEQLQLQLLEMEERENLKKLRDNEIRLTQQMRSLSKMMEQIESTCQNSIIESFEDVRGILERSEPLLLQCPEAISTELTLCHITGMREMLRKFSTDITLDPATANAYLVLSEDLKSVKHGGIRQQLPDNPERFDQSATVLGTQVFTCGRHYWEVEVGNKTEWEDKNDSIVYDFITWSGVLENNPLSIDRDRWEIEYAVKRVFDPKLPDSKACGYTRSACGNNNTATVMSHEETNNHAVVSAGLHCSVLLGLPFLDCKAVMAFFYGARQRDAMPCWVLGRDLGAPSGSCRGSDHMHCLLHNP
ncbi:hypothetical protein MG293_020349 [Ovis ammon polii]|uniref:B30.2/SPRY domain-containing protein n=1 Tax=Ovis ammon polii TaxID=230172 RepID=A0AAD4TMK9_OVIAM|nr:hypothetical protein MG293_020349 [Ovis ammon polii]